jgi:hypothetical protein
MRIDVKILFTLIATCVMSFMVFIGADKESHEEYFGYLTGCLIVAIYAAVLVIIWRS